MVQAVEHDLGSSVATVGKGAVSGAFDGLGVAGLTGAVIATTIGAVGIALASAIMPVAWGLGLAVCAGLGAVGGIATVGVPAMIAFSGFETLKSGSKVIKEQGRFNQLSENTKQNIDATIGEAQQQAYIAGMQQGHQTGQEVVLNRLQQIQEQAIAEQQRLVAEQHHNHKPETMMGLQPVTDGHHSTRVSGGNKITPQEIILQRQAQADATPSVA